MSPDFPSTVNPLLCIFNKAPDLHAARLLVNWLASKDGLEVYARAAASATTRSDIDESFIPSYSLPEPGVNYLDADSWDFILKSKKAAIQRMGELMKERK